MNAIGREEHRDLVARFAAQTRPLAPEPIARVAPRLPRFPDVAAVLFDVYGTLLVSASGDIGPAEEDTAHAMSAALAAAGFPPRSRDAGPRGAALREESVRRRHAGSRARGVKHPEVDIASVFAELLDALCSEGLVAGVPDAAAARRLALEFEARSNPAWPMPGLEAVLAALRQRRLVLGLVSNAQFYTPLLFDALLSRDLAALGFDRDVCAFSHEAGEAKPSPRLVETALAALARKHGLSPRQVLAVGNDVAKDIDPAAALGCRTVLFAADRRSFRPRADDPLAAGRPPDAVLTELAQLVPLVSGEPS